MLGNCTPGICNKIKSALVLHNASSANTMDGKTRGKGSYIDIDDPTQSGSLVMCLGLGFVRIVRCIVKLQSQRRSCHYPARSNSCIPLSFFPSIPSVVMSRMNFYHVLFVTWLGKWPAEEGGFAYGPLLDYQTWSNLVQIEPRWNNLEEIYPQSGTLLSTRLWIILRFFGLILEAI